MIITIWIFLVFLAGQTSSENAYASKCSVRYSFTVEEYEKYKKLLEKEKAKNALFDRCWTYAAQFLERVPPPLIYSETVAIMSYIITGEECNTFTEDFHYQIKKRKVHSSRFDYKSYFFFLSAAVEKLADRQTRKVYFCSSEISIIRRIDQYDLVLNSTFALVHLSRNVFQPKYEKFCYKLESVWSAPLKTINQAFGDNLVFAYDLTYYAIVPACERFRVVSMGAGFFHAVLESEFLSPVRKHENASTGPIWVAILIYVLLTCVFLKQLY